MEKLKKDTFYDFNKEKNTVQSMKEKPITVPPEVLKRGGTDDRKKPDMS